MLPACGRGSAARGSGDAFRGWVGNGAFHHTSPRPVRGGGSAWFCHADRARLTGVKRDFRAADGRQHRGRGLHHSTGPKPAKPASRAGLPRLYSPRPVRTGNNAPFVQKTQKQAARRTQLAASRTAYSIEACAPNTPPRQSRRTALAPGFPYNGQPTASGAYAPSPPPRQSRRKALRARRRAPARRAVGQKGEHLWLGSNCIRDCHTTKKHFA